ncbi:MAG TPA: hypothetical protein VKE51_31085 [Vicinamibacterales bacterium]|nr:hypothetical protein [Vicinamibacterales bacterium]
MRKLIAGALRRMKESETVYFLRLLRIARRGDPQARLSATLAWLDRASRVTGARRTSSVDAHAENA